MNDANAAVTAAPRESAISQYLTFRLAEQDYGVEILRVQEIKGWERPTRIPHSPAYALGVINLRGAVVPVIDLRLRFGLPEGAHGAARVIIVVRVSSPRGPLTAGLLVDEVCEVSNLSAADRRAPPALGAPIDATLVDGLAMSDQRMLILIDVERLVNGALSDSQPAAAAA